VERLMAKHPGDRYPTPADLADALAPYAVSGPTPWAPPRIPVAVPIEEDAPLTNLEDSGDEIEALTNTVANDDSPTPHPPSPSRIINRRGRKKAPSGGKAVLVALAISFGFLGAMGMLLALLVLFGGK
jgi:hypothetical protein